MPDDLRKYSDINTLQLDIGSKYANEAIEHPALALVKAQIVTLH